MNIILSTLMILFVLILGLCFFLLLFRLYKQKKILQKSNHLYHPNGCCYTEKIVLGGIEQTILVQTRNKDKPVLLLLHGGPGMPVPGVSCRTVDNISQLTTTKLIKDFTLIYWDQRGSGKSYHNKLDIQTMRLDQFISDACQLVDHLRVKFCTNKIYLAGISWGSVIGLKLAAKYPDKFYAYYGLAQIINWSESDKSAYPWTMERAKSLHNKKAMKDLNKIGLPPYNDFQNWNVLRNWLMKFNGYVYKDDSLVNKSPTPASFMLHLFTSPDYSIKDALNTFKGMSLAYNNEMIRDISKIDFMNIHEINIPVYFYHGRHDKVCDVDLMQKFFDQLHAPLGKHLVWLENSAHFFYKDDAEKVEKEVIDSSLI